MYALCRRKYIYPFSVFFTFPPPRLCNISYTHEMRPLCDVTITKLAG